MPGGEPWMAARRGVSRLLRTHPRHPLRGLATFVRHERAFSRGRTLRDRLETVRSGFLSRSRELYDFARYDPALYLTDYARLTRTLHINGSWSGYLDDKLSFHAVFDGRLPLPRLRGILVGGRFVPTRGGGDEGTLEALLEARHALVLKPRHGSFGHGVHLVRADPKGGVRVNGVALAGERLLERFPADDDYIVTDFVEQAPYATRIHPQTTNTLRVLTILPADGDAPFLAAAVHRFGGRGSGHLDSFSGGGVSAEVDLGSGRLGPAARLTRNGVEWHSHHPDSGQPVERTQVPHWDSVREALLAAVEELAVPYVGWDVVVTEKGFRVIEGNSHSGMHVFQAHRPLLADPRVRRFFEHHGVVHPARAGR